MTLGMGDWSHLGVPVRDDITSKFAVRNLPNHHPSTPLLQAAIEIYAYL